MDKTPGFKLIMLSMNRLYRILLENYGNQGWWPLINNATLISEYSGRKPVKENEYLEIFIGAILTQNISWKNVEKAIIRLKVNNALSVDSLVNIEDEELAGLIKPTGYYNQKAKKIKNFLQWFMSYDYSFKKIKAIEPDKLRNELLSIKGIGPETADSILLYAFSINIFVVDAYTMRLLKRIGILSGKENYHEIQEIFHKKFNGKTIEYNEYHALIVAHCKNACMKTPKCHDCCLKRNCNKNY